jgi:hypothetical protein
MAMKFYYPKSYGFYSRDNYSHMMDKKLNEVASDIEILAEKEKTADEIIDYIKQKYEDYFIWDYWEIEKEGNFIFVRNKEIGDEIKVDIKTDREVEAMEKAFNEFIGDKQIFEVLKRENKKVEYAKEELTREELIEEFYYIVNSVLEDSNWDVEDKVGWEIKDGVFKAILEIKRYENFGLGYYELLIKA